MIVFSCLNQLEWLTMNGRLRSWSGWWSLGYRSHIHAESSTFLLACLGWRVGPLVLSSTQTESGLKNEVSVHWKGRPSFVHLQVCLSRKPETLLYCSNVSSGLAPRPQPLKARARRRRAASASLGLSMPAHA